MQICYTTIELISNSIPAKNRNLAGHKARDTRRRNHRYTSSRHKLSDRQPATFSSKASFEMSSLAFVTENLAPDDADDNREG